ncbi:hypothetical protein ACJX0J_039043, partial [Zea mays]
MDCCFSFLLQFGWHNIGSKNSDLCYDMLFIEPHMFASHFSHLKYRADKILEICMGSEGILLPGLILFDISVCLFFCFACYFNISNLFINLMNFDLICVSGRMLYKSEYKFIHVLLRTVCKIEKSNRPYMLSTMFLCCDHQLCEILFALYG